MLVEGVISASISRSADLRKRKSMYGDEAKLLRPRVCLLLDHPSQHMIEFLNAIAADVRCAAQVVYLRNSDSSRNWGQPYGKLPYQVISDRRIPPIAILNVVKRLKADVWIVNTCYTDLQAWGFVSALNLCNIPWVYMNEPLRPRQLVFDIREFAVRLLLRKATAIIGMGHFSKNYYDGLFPQKRTASIPYYVDLEPFASVERRKKKAGIVRFLTVGQMIHRKGFDILLEACKRLPDEGWRLTLVGDGPLLDCLRNLFAENFGIEKANFLGRVDFERRASVFASHDVFVFPSRWDGWGMAPVEAMASGLPVIATEEVVSMREFIVDGVNGYIIPADDASTLRNRMINFIKEPGKIDQMGQRARESLRTYQPEQGVENLLRIISDVPKKHLPKNRALGKREAITWMSLTEPRSLHERARTAAKSIYIQTRSAFQRRHDFRENRILAYHLVLQEDAKRFEDHIKFLKDNYELATVVEILNLAKNPKLGRPLLAITFDDAFSELMHTALDVLTKHSVKATFFVPTTFVRLRSDREKAEEFCLSVHYYKRALEPMSFDDLVALRKAGHEIASHGVSHFACDAISETVARFELDQSKLELRNWIGQDVKGFAYPYGIYKGSAGDAAAWVREAGYEYAVTMRRGGFNGSSDKFTLPREHTEGCWPLRDLMFFLNDYPAR
jgi:glycosyltransferase involved in cell wall biosynthesis/peptidoglycan/xylan/chitin deacetylase (PgdA/CDA1 family)